MNDLTHFLNQVVELKAIERLVSHFSNKKIKSNKIDWEFKFKLDPVEATNILSEELAEAYTNLVSSLPKNNNKKSIFDVVKEESKPLTADEIQSLILKVSAEVFESKNSELDKPLKIEDVFPLLQKAADELPKPEKGDPGLPGKDAPQINEIKTELQKIVSKIKLPEVSISSSEIEKITAEIQKKFDSRFPNLLREHKKKVRDSLEGIKKEDDKLSQSAIKDLPGRLKKVDARLKRLYDLINEVSKSGDDTTPQTFFAGITAEEAAEIAQQIVNNSGGGGGVISFETIRRNQNSYDILSEVNTLALYSRTYDTPDGDIIYTVNFDGNNDPSTATLTGLGVPVGIDTLKTYDFTGGTVVVYS